jgi:hypothetical protein
MKAQAIREQAIQQDMNVPDFREMWRRMSTCCKCGADIERKPGDDYEGLVCDECKKKEGIV